MTGPPPAAGFSLADLQMSPASLVLACPQGEAPRAHRQTMEFRDRYRWRAGIEGTISAYDRLTGVKHLHDRGLKAVRDCATLKAVGVNLFRATAGRRDSNRAMKTGQGSKSRLPRFISGVKEQITAMGNAIDQFFIPDAYYGPFELKMAA